MNCREFQDRLLEQFGEKILPADLAGHVASCAECKSFWAELHTLGASAGDNAAFYPKPHESELVAEFVDREIRSEDRATVVRPTAWLKYVAVAAAVALVSITATMWKWPEQAGQLVVSSDSLVMNADTTDSSSEEELSGYAVSTLLVDFAGRTSYSAGEDLLGDLTDEEAAYLETELKAGDLL
jgi:hypothetical protein